MKTIAIASLLSLSCAAADRTPRPPPPPRVPIFSEEVLPEGAADVDRVSLALFADGMIERTERRHGAATRATGHLDAGQVAAIRAALAKPAWKVVVQDIHCMAMGVAFTRFAIDGKPVYDQHVCGDNLDPESAQALSFVRGLVEKAVPTAPAPACTQGSALFGEEELPTSGGSWDTYAITVYDGGAWERIDRARTGGEARSNGCLDAGQIATIKAALATATWQAPAQAIHCMARGATFTRFSVNGKPVYDQQVCGDPLDADSAKALDAVRDIVDQAAAPHTPPCCKK